MLVFTRKRDEAIMIGDGIEIRVLRIGREGVRLGVRAPAQVAVHRLEIYEEICTANQGAALAGSVITDEPHEAANPGEADDGH